MFVHEVAQQTPCAQLFDAHSAPLEQNAPFGFLPHELPTQTLPAEQFASAVQAPKHWLPLQVNGTQRRVALGLQLAATSGNARCASCRLQ